MATEAEILTSAPRKTVSRPVNRTFERTFYTGMAILLCVCVYIGFSPTYFQAGMLHAPLPSPILHVHGAVFTLWMLLFIVQAALVSAHRVKMAPLAGHGRLLSSAHHDRAWRDRSYRRSSPRGEDRGARSHCLLCDTDVRLLRPSRW